MTLNIEKELKNLPDNFVVGLVVNSDKYENVKMDILKYLTNKKRQSGSYVAINKPYQATVDDLKQNKVNTDKLYFIDCITKKFGGKGQNTKNCVFIDSPGDLTEISLELHQSMQNQERKFLFVDSLSTLAVYNNPEMILKFIHYLTGKIRIWGLSGVLIALNEETDKKIIAELAQFCDKIIKA